MRKLLFLFFVLASPLAAFAQGYRYDNFVLKPLPAGGVTPVSGALITVCTSAGTGTPCTPKVANIYSDEALTTPITGTGGAGTTNSDANGNYGFYITPGDYILTITGTGITSATVKITLPCTTASGCNSSIYIGGNAPQIGGSADIGAQINAAYATAPAIGEKIFLLPQSGGGCYNFSTPIVLSTAGKYFPIEGIYTANQTGPTPQGVCLNYTPTTATTAITIDYIATQGGNFVPFSPLENILLYNNSCNNTVGGCGSLATGISFGPNNNGAHMGRLKNVKIAGFSVGFNYNSNGSWGMLLDNMTLTHNATGASFPVIAENVKWIGGTISENGTGINCQTASDMTLLGVSMDNNSTWAINNSNCNITLEGMHWENAGPGSPNANYITQSNGQFSILGGVMMNDHNGGTLASMMTVSGGFFDIRGLLIVSGDTLTNLINNTGGGVGHVTWFDSGSSATVAGDIAGVPATCTTAYRCVVERILGDSPPMQQLTIPVARFPFLGAGSPAGTASTAWMYFNGSLNRLNLQNNGETADNVNGTRNVLTAGSTDNETNKSFGAGSLVPVTAGATDIGSAAKPFGNLWLGTAATNNFKFQPAATAAARTISIADPLGNTSLPLTIASGTKALNTASITTATCDAGAAVTATGTLSTDTVDWSFNAAPTATNKYGAFLVVYAVPSANTVTFYTCNPSATTSTPTAMTVNWSVRRP